MHKRTIEQTETSLQIVWQHVTTEEPNLFTKHFQSILLFAKLCTTAVCRARIFRRCRYTG